MKYTVQRGSAAKLGAHIHGQGVSFALFSRHAYKVYLHLFHNADDTVPYFTVCLDAQKNRTGDIWHVFISEIGAGTFYLYTIDGLFVPEEGHRFNVYKYVQDPYARAFTAVNSKIIDSFAHLAYNHESALQDLSFSQETNIEVIPKCIVIDDTDFDWHGDMPLNYNEQNIIIYEGHVKGLTQHPSAPVKHHGTYRGIIELIPYLSELGITSLELLPIFQFNYYEYSDRVNPLTNEPLVNYWGYSTTNFFAPEGRYSSAGHNGQQVNEFKEMVRELHKAGIEVILDVVFNHTSEGNELGSTTSFRGIDNQIYYMLASEKRYYMNFSGCGNTFNCNHPVVKDFIIDCLRYWVLEMHVDGFRFDLAPILGRQSNGALVSSQYSLVNRIAEDSVLQHTKIIAEPWDAGGAYLLGHFAHKRWCEWNDKYRDCIRKFWRNDDNEVAALATRIAGSSDLYDYDDRKPFHSINFVTAHDGFTLNDVVSYNEKHNEANGENNADGHNHNYSYNYGVEGETHDFLIQDTRNRMVKNYLATLFLSIGTPMMFAGDEIRNTQYGNNNAYCQDNEISWINYDLLQKHAGIFRFTKELIALRKRHATFHRGHFLTGRDNVGNKFNDVSWYSEYGVLTNWDEQDNVLAVFFDGSRAEIRAEKDDAHFFIIFNASVHNRTFYLPLPPSGQHWYRCIDTSLDSPDDIVNIEDLKKYSLINSREYVVKSQSLILLIAFINEY